jgi:hypothetical protein
MNTVILNNVLFCCISVSLLACGDPLVAPELIANTRVLAARTEAAGDVNRASVMPAEAASIRWLVATPNGPPSLGSSYSACIAESVSRGLPICAASPFAQFTSSEVSSSEPRFDLTLPDADSLGTTPQVVVSAGFCSSGVPINGTMGLDFATTRCPDASEPPLFATFELSAALDGTTNANPDFSRVQIQFDGAQWPISNDEQALSAACASQDFTIPHVAAGGTNHEILLSVPSDMSEPLSQRSVHSASRETLALAHFVTTGDLERAYSNVNVQTDPALVRVNWKSPGSINTNGALVRFYFVLRDGRGGADYTQRALCVTP